MTLLLWIGVVIIVFAAIVKKFKEGSGTIVFGNGMDPNNPQNQDPNNPFKNGFPPFGNCPNGFPQGKPGNANEQMVCCEHCRVYIPVSQSQVRAGHVFCSHAHATAWFSSDHSNDEKA